MNKAKVLKAYETCSTMINHWKNGLDPAPTYSRRVEEIREILSELLEMTPCPGCQCGGKCGG